MRYMWEHLSHLALKTKSFSHLGVTLNCSHLTVHISLRQVTRTSGLCGGGLRACPTVSSLLLPNALEECTVLPHWRPHWWVLINGWRAEAVSATSEPAFIACVSPSRVMTLKCSSEGRDSRWHTSGHSACLPGLLSHHMEDVALESHSHLQWTGYGISSWRENEFCCIQLPGFGGLALSNTNDYKSVTKEKN